VGVYVHNPLDSERRPRRLRGVEDVPKGRPSKQTMCKDSVKIPSMLLCASLG
jgi:hypothetical protein